MASVGAVRLSADDPRFARPERVSRSMFSFPRTACVFEPDGCRSFTADPTVVTWHGAGQSFRRRPVDPRGDVCEWFSVREDVLRDALAERVERTRGAVPPSLPGSHTPSADHTYLVQRIIARYVARTPEPDTAAVDEAVVRLLNMLLDDVAQRTGDAQRSSRDAEIAEAVAAAVRSTFPHALPLDALAARVGVSVFHMCRRFRASTGHSIHDYRSRLRLRCALEKVGEGRDGLSSLAHELGYSSHSHFTDSFRTAFGCTPSEFRRAARSACIRDLFRRLRLDQSW